MINGAGTASVVPGGGSGNYSYSWKLKNGSTELQKGTNAASFSYTCSQAGTLTVECTVTDNVTGQTVTNSKDLTCYTYPTASVSTGAPWYMINGAGTASVVPGGGSGNYSYSWKLKNGSTELQKGTNAASFSYTCSQAGTLTAECTVTDNVTGQTVTNSKDLICYTYPTASVSTGAPWYMINGAGTASVVPGGGSGNYSYSWKLKNSSGTVLQTSTTGSSFNYTCSQSGTLTAECTVTDNVTGQTVTNSKDLTCYTYPTASVSTGAPWYMINGTGTANVVPGGGSGNYSYSWTFKNLRGVVLQSSTSGNSFSYSCPQSGTLYVQCTVTDNVTGQAATGSRNITCYDYPTATVATGAPWYVINGTGTATVSVPPVGGSGTYSYSWALKNGTGAVLQSSSSGNSFSYKCSQSGILTVACTVTDMVTKQTTTAEKDITCYTYPTAAVTTGASWCIIKGTGTASISPDNGSGNYSYRWALKNSSGSVLQSSTSGNNFNYTCSQSGILTVAGTVVDNVTGQTTTATKTITCYTYPTASATTGASWYMINGAGTASVIASSGSGKYSYSWKLMNSSNTVLQSSNSGNSFSYTCPQSGTLAVQCSVTDTITGETATSLKNITCYTYPTAVVTTGASWYVINGTGIASVSPAGGSGNYTYSWALKNSSGNVLQSSSSGNTFGYTCSQSGTLTVNCTVTDNVTGQTATGSKTITCYTYPTMSVSVGASWYMINGTATASVIAGSGSGKYSYSWKLKNSAGTELQSGTNSTSFSYTCQQGGTFAIVCMVTDTITGQTVTGSKVITCYTYPTATLTVGANWYKINGPGTASVSAGGGSGNYSYLWKLVNSSGTVLQSNTSGISFSYTCSQSGTLTVQCTVTDKVTGQTATGSKDISCYAAPTSSVTTDASRYMINGTGTANVSADGGSGQYSYSWYLKNSSGNVLQSSTTGSNFSYTCSQNGTLTLLCTVTDKVTGLATTSSKTITCYTYLTVSVTTGASWYMINATGSATASATGGSGNYSYNWSLANESGTLKSGTGSSFSFTCSQSGSLVLTCTATDNVTGQTSSVNKTIPCYSTPTVGISVGASSYPQNATGSATVSVSGGSGNFTYSWTLLYGTTTLGTGGNSTGFSFKCSRTGTLTVKCIVTDNVTKQTKTVTQNISCTAITGNATPQSDYIPYSNSLSGNGSIVPFNLICGTSSPAMHSGQGGIFAEIITAASTIKRLGRQLNAFIS
jgi:hypothetical protein